MLWLLIYRFGSILKIKRVKVLENKSINRAREIISIHLRRLEEELSNELLSVILVGSISNNSYTGNTGSDIDLIHILKDEASDNYGSRIQGVRI
jgi:predicted nucleotidyltransferase